MTEATPAPSGTATVVLELGPGTGALILHTPAALNGQEIEISPDHPPGAARTHSQVRQRRTGSTTQYAAVYPQLAAGHYTIWRDPATPAATATITSGQVTSLHWPA